MAKSKEVQQHVSAAVVIAGIEKDASKIFKRLADIKVSSKDEYEKAGLLLKELKDYAKVGKAKEDSIREPLKKADKEVAALFKPFYERVATTEQLVKSMMLKFIEKQEQQQQKLTAKLESGEIAKVSTYLKKTEQLKVESSGTVQQRTVKQLKCLDESKTPREFLIADEQAIKKALLSGVDVPGWKLEEVKTLAV